MRDLALEAMVERVAKWGDVRAKFPLTGPAAGALAEVERLVTRGDDALDGRERAVAVLAGVSLDMKAWREEANLARRAAEAARDGAAKPAPQTPSRVAPPNVARPSAAPVH